MFHVGLRTFKTGLAVMISVIVGQYFDFLEYPFFIAMTAIISMDKTMFTSLKMGRNRVFGTFLGACIGILLSYIDRGNPVLCGIGMIALIQICNILKLQGSITIGGIVMIAIMVHTDKTPFYYGFHRTLDTFIGAAISFIVNMTVFPYSRLRTINKTISYSWLMLDHIINEISESHEVELGYFRDELVYLKRDIDLIHSELVLTKKQKESVAQLEKHYEIAKKVFFELEVCQSVNQDEEKDIFDYHINKATQIYRQYEKEFQPIG